VYKKSNLKRNMSYEQLRLDRIKENEALLSDLGIMKAAVKPVKRHNLQLQREVSKPSRESKRLKGELPEFNKENVVDNNISDEDDEEIEFNKDALLVERWKMHVQNQTSDDKESTNGKRRLFLVPTGIPGLNDHTLDSPVEAVGSHLWGFCEGLMTRIFVHIRPGDILLMTSSGGGSFNRIALVKETRVVSKSMADTFWRRMSFSMGGTSKNNVGFPLLVPLHPPIDVDWNKKDVMKMLGYTDHLQSSRMIKHQKMETETGRLVYKRCCAHLKVPQGRTDAEIQ